MGKPTNVRPVSAAVYFLPIATRMPLKFGPEVTTEVTCARVRVTVADAKGRRSEGWGETPLSVQWVWPSALSYAQRHDVLTQFCLELASEWMKLKDCGHPLEAGHHFLEQNLHAVWTAYNARLASSEPMP